MVVAEPIVLNSYWYNYFPGHFVLHWAGVRGPGLKDTIDKYCPNITDEDTYESYANRKNYINNQIRQEFDTTLNNFKNQERMDAEANF